MGSDRGGPAGRNETLYGPTNSVGNAYGHGGHRPGAACRKRRRLFLARARALGRVAERPTFYGLVMRFAAFGALTVEPRGRRVWFLAEVVSKKST